VGGGRSLRVTRVAPQGVKKCFFTVLLKALSCPLLDGVTHIFVGGLI